MRLEAVREQVSQRLEHLSVEERQKLLRILVGCIVVDEHRFQANPRTGAPVPELLPTPQ
jgi:hypothetical protein